MKRSISNIGWTAQQDADVYRTMAELGYTGLEIAPTRLFLEDPYHYLNPANRWAREMYEVYGFRISSMQSIWYGRQEKVFGTPEERKILLEYTKRAIQFAGFIGCGNLVFGCPRNRAVPEGMGQSEVQDIACAFFRELGDYAAHVGTVLAMEANPPIYNTNYINGTAQALELVKQVGSRGFLLNLDVGTMICNKEPVSLLLKNVPYINHVHISEPGLKPITPRPLHGELLSLLKQKGYDRFVSIEMGKQETIAPVEDALRYLAALEDA